MPKGNPSYGKGHYVGRKKGIVQGAVAATLVIGAIRLIVQAVRGR